MEEGAIVLAGRRVGYGAVGTRDGAPVVLFHPTLGSRRPHLGEAEAGRARVRTIVRERPAYGLADPRPGWTLADVAADAVALADGLGLGRVAVVGVSGVARYLARALPRCLACPRLSSSQSVYCSGQRRRGLGRPRPGPFAFKEAT